MSIDYFGKYGGFGVVFRNENKWVDVFIRFKSL